MFIRTRQFSGLLTLILVLSLIFCGVNMGFADGGKGGSGSDDTHPEDRISSGSSSDSSNSSGYEPGDDKYIKSGWISEKDILKVEHKDQAELEKSLRHDLDDYLHDLKDELKGYELLYKQSLQTGVTTGSAITSGSGTGGQDPILAQIMTIKKEVLSAKVEIRDRIRSGYTAEQLANLEKIKAELKALAPDLKVLDVDSIIKSGGDLKFDVPPVIKGGRTLIPARAISEGFGADVQWNPEKRTVTITKGSTVIVLVVGEKEATVNGKVVPLDTKAEILGNRTVVPMSFIATQLGLKVEWDADSGTIEIKN